MELNEELRRIREGESPQRKKREDPGKEDDMVQEPDSGVCSGVSSVRTSPRRRGTSEPTPGEAEEKMPVFDACPEGETVAEPIFFGLPSLGDVSREVVRGLCPLSAVLDLDQVTENVWRLYALRYWGIFEPYVHFGCDDNE